MTAPVVYVTGDPESPLGDIGKIVTVDAVGTPGINCDYATIKDACAYLKSLPGNIGGIIALRGNQVHIVDTVVDGSGITFQSGRYTPAPIIRAATGGRLIANGCSFRSIIIDVPITFGGVFLLDFNNDSRADFLSCDFHPATGKAIFGNSGAAVALRITFRECGQTVTTGFVVDPASAFTAPSYEVLGTNGGPSIQFGAVDVKVNADGRMDTTGQITGLPAGRLFVAPTENVQSRLDSLAADGNGGIVYLLPGVHPTTKPIDVLGDGITFAGYGEGTIVLASNATWDYVTYPANHVLGNAIIRVGRQSDDTVVDGCAVSSIHLITDVINHGIYVYGGSDNRVEDCSVEATGQLIYPGSWACVGILATDSQYALAERIVVDDCTVEADITNHWFCDAFHLDGGAPGGFSGVYGFGNRIQDSSVIECISFSADQTVYELSMADGCMIYIAQGRLVPYDPNGIVMGILDCNNCSFICVTALNAGVAGASAVWMWSSHRCTFINSFLDGGNLGFAVGVYITAVPGGVSVTNCIVGDNVISNCGIGISITTGCSNNTIEPNQFFNCGTDLVDVSGGLNRYTPEARVGVGTPNGAVVGHFADEFLDTNTGTWYKCNSYPQGNSWSVI